MENNTSTQNTVAPRQYTTSSKSSPPRQPSTQILKELNESEAMELRPKPGMTIGVILCAGFDIDDEGKILTIPEMLHITEWQTFGNGYKVTKLPAGSMDIEDKDIFAAGDRELFGETGYVTTNGWKFARAVETTSTKPGERHFKVFLVTTNPKLVGKPTEKCIMEDGVVKSPIPLIHNFMTYDQRIGLRHAIDIMRCASVGFGYGLMNHIPVDWICR